MRPSQRQRRTAPAGAPGRVFVPIDGEERRPINGGVINSYKILYISVMKKELEFRGSALKDLRAFPPLARKEAGYQLDKVQDGQEPNDWKPMPGIGVGIREIRLREAAGAFRVVYVAKFEQAVYVLHCFQKKTQQTSAQDIELASKRYRELLQEQDNERTEDEKTGV